MSDKEVEGVGKEEVYDLLLLFPEADKDGEEGFHATAPPPVVLGGPDMTEMFP